MSSITTTLGSGSGIDTKALVTGLVSAQFEPKAKALAAREEKLTAQVSALAQLKSGLTGFSNALGALVGGGTLSTQPVSGDTSLFTVKASGGTPIGTLARELEVKALAAGQTLSSAPVADGAAAPSGTGTLVIRFGNVTGDGSGFAAKAGASPVRIAIEEGQDSLAGLAGAINAAGAGITASVIGEGNAARLSLRGPTGSENGFTVAAEEGDVPGLARFTFGSPGAAMTLGRGASDAEVAIDGVTVRRPSNEIADLVPGVTLNLLKADPGRIATLSSSRPNAAISQAVDDVVAAFNELRGMLKSETDPVSGTLGGDTAVRAMARDLATLTSTRLVEGVAPGAPTTLAEIGVRTNRDGTLSVDKAQLAAAVTKWPDVVEAMFSPRQGSSSPLLAVTSSAGRAAPGVYTVTDIRPATSGRLIGTAVPNAFNTPVTIDAANRTITLMLNDGAPVAIELAEGSYASGQALASAFNAAVAAVPALAGRASGAWAEDRFTISSALEGAASSVAIVGGDAALATRIGMRAATATAGTDAAGKVDGVDLIYSAGSFSAPATSPAAGLIFRAGGEVASASIRIDRGLGPALEKIARQLTASGSGLSLSETRYTASRSTIATDKAKIAAAAERMTSQLTRQFAGMDARVAAYKSTQSFLDQQIKAWTRDS